ncbi:MAG: DegT/DnrJ/EryC1/StrS family aminotransferase [Nanoarchaeota archaeon]|nr:DegT/DnrJ/EryC1/StrS family aminotransferase [Nanoarchaeota archaeon]
MRVGYSYLKEQFGEHKKIFEEIENLLETSDFTLGKPVEEFEQKFAKLCDTKYAVGVGSGTDALLLSLKALDIGAGDEVITTPNTFFATVGAIVTAGATPVFVDNNEEYTIDTALIDDVVTEKTKAIMPVHLTGCPSDMPTIMDIADKHNLQVVEDACQAISASIDGKKAGSFGITGAFSLHPLKNLNVWGDGGLITTNSDEMRDKLRLLRNHGLINRDVCEFFAYNSRLDSLQAIVGNYLIEKAEDITNTRIENAKYYDEKLSKLSDITIPHRRKNVRQVYHTYVIQAKERDKLLEFLLEKDIEAKIHYPIPMHLQPAAKYLGYKEGDFPVCEAQTRTIITLPVHQHLTDEQKRYVVDKVKEFYR